ncbi:hypothetical protein D3C81_1931510 [compost metagenome]
MLNFFVRRCFIPVADIIRNGAGEQHGLLRHEADLRPKLLLGNVTDILTVNQHAAAAHIIEARYQADQC